MVFSSRQSPSNSLYSRIITYIFFSFSKNSRNAQGGALRGRGRVRAAVPAPRRRPSRPILEFREFIWRMCLVEVRRGDRESSNVRRKGPPRRFRLSSKQPLLAYRHRTKVGNFETFDAVANVLHALRHVVIPLAGGCRTRTTTRHDSVTPTLRNRENTPESRKNTLKKNKTHQLFQRPSRPAPPTSRPFLSVVFFLECVCHIPQGQGQPRAVDVRRGVQPTVSMEHFTFGA